MSAAPVFGTFNRGSLPKEYTAGLHLSRPLKGQLLATKALIGYEISVTAFATPPGTYRFALVSTKAAME